MLLELFAKLQRTIGGSSETELKLFAVIPTSPPLPPLRSDDGHPSCERSERAAKQLGVELHRRVPAWLATHELYFLHYIASGQPCPIPLLHACAFSLTAFTRPMRSIEMRLQCDAEVAVILDELRRLSAMTNFLVAFADVGSHGFDRALVLARA